MRLVALGAAGVVALSSVATAAPGSAAAPKPAPRATAVPVQVDTVTTGVKAALPGGPTGVLSVRLVDNDEYVAQRYVAAVAASGTRVADGFTNAAGRIALKVPASKSGYAVCISDDNDLRSPVYPQCVGHGVPWDYRKPFTAANRYPVRAGQHRAVGTVTLAHGGSVSGQIHTRSGHGVHTETYARSLSHPSIVAYTVLGGPNHYMLTGLAPSRRGWAVCFRGGRYVYVDGEHTSRLAGSCSGGGDWDGGPIPKTARAVHVRPDAVTHHVNGVLRTGATITGKVTDAGSGAKLIGVVVELFDKSGAMVGGQRLTQYRKNFRFEGLRTGQVYRVCAAPDHNNPHWQRSYFGHCYRGSAWELRTHPNGRLAPTRRGHITRIDVPIEKAASISGTVTDDLGSPDPHAEVYLYDSAGKPVDKVPTGRRGDKAGQYRLMYLTPDTGDGYTVCAVEEKTGSQSTVGGSAPACDGDQAWTGPGSPRPPDAPPVQVTAGNSTDDIDIALPHGAGISGSVRAAGSGARLHDTVYVYNGDGHAVRAQSVHGRFSITGLEQSSEGYRVCFSGAAAHGGPAAQYHGQCFKKVAWSH